MSISVFFFLRGGRESDIHPSILMKPLWMNPGFLEILPTPESTRWAPDPVANWVKYPEKKKQLPIHKAIDRAYNSTYNL